MVDTQFPAICIDPVGVEVGDHGVLPAVVTPELVEVFFVKAAFFVQGIVKFISGNAGVAGFI